MNSRHPDPRRVLGRCRAAVRGQDPLDPVDPLDPGMGSFLRALGIKNNENESPNSTLLISPSLFVLFVINCSCSLCFTMNLDYFLLKSCSTAAPAALGGCGGMGQLWDALAELTVQCAHVQCAHCTVCSLYSEHTELTQTSTASEGRRSSF